MVAARARAAEKTAAIVSMAQTIAASAKITRAASTLGLSEADDVKDEMVAVVTTAQPEITTAPVAEIATVTEVADLGLAETRPTLKLIRGGKAAAKATKPESPLPETQHQHPELFGPLSVTFTRRPADLPQKVRARRRAGVALDLAGGGDPSMTPGCNCHSLAREP
jgi:hypothetical protein